MSACGCRPTYSTPSDAEAIRNAEAAALQRTLRDAERVAEIETLFAAADRLEQDDLVTGPAAPAVRRLRQVARRMSEES
jgi:hypothetical protein